jgi:15-cis-phytoene synthase
MEDAFAHCAELVRTADRDRFLASLFAPADHRDALHALYAFNIEVTRVREAAREPLPGEIRLQWWSDVLNGERTAEAQANPVAAALLATVGRYGLVVSTLMALIEASRFDLYDEPMGTVADLEAYAKSRSSVIFALAAQIVAGVGAEIAAGPAGIAYAIAGLLRALPLHASRGQLYLPIELLDRHQVRPQDIFAGKSSAGLKAALSDLRAIAREHLRAAQPRIVALRRSVMPVFLPIALARPSLDRLERSDPFAPREIPAWRRQWLIWRAARNPARIAG